jgi:type IV pilus assembly protein PilA
MKRMSKSFLITLAAIAAVVLSVAIPNFIRARSTSAANACVNNLRQIDSAKQQWMLENGKTTNEIPSWDAVRPYLGRGPEGEIPKCPKGGTYILGRVGELPRCSIGGSGHSL